MSSRESVPLSCPPSVGGCPGAECDSSDSYEVFPDNLRQSSTEEIVARQGLLNLTGQQQIGGDLSVPAGELLRGWRLVDARARSSRIGKTVLKSRRASHSRDVCRRSLSLPLSNTITTHLPDIDCQPAVSKRFPRIPGAGSRVRSGQAAALCSVCVICGSSAFPAGNARRAAFELPWSTLCWLPSHCRCDAQTGHFMSGSRLLGSISEGTHDDR
ncbi:hypothetical protein Mal4_50690 [Maioricimonas rarisocia]|uniref:Uncharacterized protein n=1 Tax=Maioricimonas rarisocia TaxID=2528026 RepID=A0A517ZE00_9PLAN|nr:hypothetical protein Mal4_50690 [Maioricimonas rarisocia]